MNPSIPRPGARLVGRYSCPSVSSVADLTPPPASDPYARESFQRVGAFLFDAVANDMGWDFSWLSVVDCLEGRYFDADSATPSAACPAASRAVGTRNGEQET
jgi:hypothetical protein